MYLRRTVGACYCCSLALFTKSSNSFVTTTKTRQIGRSQQRSLALVSSGRFPARTRGFRSSAVIVIIRQMSTEIMDAEVAANFKAVQDRVAKAAADVGANVRLVAVSKTKPIEMLQAAYEAGCRCFGENYVQELVEKVELWSDRVDVQWHFIGALQSNKCNTLVNCISTDVSRLTIETVSSTKIANKLNKAVTTFGTDKRLKVFVQVNTSAEDSKSGVEPGKECVDLCQHIVKECAALELRGLMTIGAPGDVGCFQTLLQCRAEVADAFEEAGMVDQGPLELSMGMSGDFEAAIAAGATNVRVGSTIFGDRDYSKHLL